MRQQKNRVNLNEKTRACNCWIPKERTIGRVSLFCKARVRLLAKVCILWRLLVEFLERGTGRNTMWLKRTHAPEATRGSRSIITPLFEPHAHTTYMDQHIRTLHFQMHRCSTIQYIRTNIIHDGSTALHYLLYTSNMPAKYLHARLARLFEAIHICVIVPAGSTEPYPVDCLYLSSSCTYILHGSKILGIDHAKRSLWSQDVLDDCISALLSLLVLF